MPIKSVVQQYTPGRGMVQIGKLFKGAARTAEDIEKKRPGRDLDRRFRVEFGPAFQDRAYREVFEQLYGDGTVIDRALLLARSPDEALSHWFEEWGKSGLFHRCDGEQQAAWFDRSQGRVSYE